MAAVVPPDQAVYVKAGFAADDAGNPRVKPNTLAWVLPPRPPQSAAAGSKQVELAALNQIATHAITEATGRTLQLLGVVYTDSPLRAPPPDRLESVAVAVMGVVTLVDAETFGAGNKAACTAGKFVHARLTSTTQDTELAITPTANPPTPDWQRVGMLLEVGSNSDARIALGF